MIMKVVHKSGNLRQQVIVLRIIALDPGQNPLTEKERQDEQTSRYKSGLTPAWSHSNLPIAAMTAPHKTSAAARDKTVPCGTCKSHARRSSTSSHQIKAYRQAQLQSCGSCSISPFCLPACFQITYFSLCNHPVFFAEPAESLLPFHETKYILKEIPSSIVHSAWYTGRCSP